MGYLNDFLKPAFGRLAIRYSMAIGALFRNGQIRCSGYLLCPDRLLQYSRPYSPSLIVIWNPETLRQHVSQLWSLPPPFRTTQPPPCRD